MVTISIYAKWIQDNFCDGKMPKCVFEEMSIYSADFLCINWQKGFYFVHSLNCSCAGTKCNSKFSFQDYLSIFDYCGKDAAVLYTFHSVEKC